ncbi:hypothetical protein F5887DRAFT_919755 [Amanita rubescens]|nr:hypothetical protein F5887DRAFT_919755 [Amanita rubescens]
MYQQSVRTVISIGSGPLLRGLGFNSSVPTSGNFPAVYPGPISAGIAYGGPSNGTSNCTCNTVTYSVLCACGYCQDGGCVSWSDFTQNCSQTFLKKYPETIPNEINVPHWAYLDILDDNFNVTAAASASGIIGAGLSVALVFWVYKRHKSQRATQASAWWNGQEILLSHRLYNPDDPSTFPLPNDRFTQIGTEGTIHTVELRRQYTGLPEV